MSSPIAFREFSEDDYRKFIQTLSDEEPLKAGKRLRMLCGDVVLTTSSAFQRQPASEVGSGEGTAQESPPAGRVTDDYYLDFLCL